MKLEVEQEVKRINEELDNILEGTKKLIVIIRNHIKEVNNPSPKLSKPVDYDRSTMPLNIVN